MIPKIYKFRLSTRITSACAILLFSVGFVFTIWEFFIRARDPSKYVWGVFCLVGFGFMLRRFSRQALHCISYRFELGDQWVAVRDIGSLTVLPFNKLAGFAEEPLMSEGKLSGYRFGFLGADDTQILFSTQIVGWAEIIQTVHRVLPARVPDVQTLEARSVLSSLELSPDAAAFTAPGEDSPASWQAANIARWYDSWLGYLLGLALIWKPVLWLASYLKSNGTTGLWPILIIVPAALIPCQLIGSWVTSAIRRTRQKSESDSEPHSKYLSKMFTYLKNIVSGKNSTFYDTFRVTHLRLRDAASCLPPPSDEVQAAFIQRFHGYLDGACEFSHALFYGFLGRSPVFSDDELRGIGAANGERLYCLLVVCLIRSSLPSEPAIADSFCNISRLVFPERVAPVADRVASALRTTDPQEVERNIVSILRQILPSLSDNPVTRVKFGAYLAAFASVLNENTLNALSEGARNA